MEPILESIITEQIAALHASAAVFVQNRADALAAAEVASVQESGARARAADLQTALDAARAPSGPEDA